MQFCLSHSLFCQTCKSACFSASTGGIPNYTSGCKNAFFHVPPAFLSDIQVRLLLSIDRRQSAEEAMDTARLAVQLKDEGVAGLDLSGNPSVGQVKSSCNLQ